MIEEQSNDKELLDLFKIALTPVEAEKISVGYLIKDNILMINLNLKTTALFQFYQQFPNYLKEFLLINYQTISMKTTYFIHNNMVLEHIIQLNKQR